VIEINDGCMILTVDGKVVATARLSRHAAGNGGGAWIVSSRPAWLFTRDQAITALTAAKLGESGYPDSHPLVVVLQAELR
jgi:hypothetical protein